jgi:hypothetical protein
MTALLAKFSEAIRMMLLRCRSSSSWIAAYISGSCSLRDFNQITVMAMNFIRIGEDEMRRAK